MTTTKSHESEEHAPLEAVSPDTVDWIHTFIKHLELHLVGAARDLPPNASHFEWEVASARAILETYLDSGMQPDAVMELIGRVGLEPRSASTGWSDDLNRRRFALIDREIQGVLTPAERVELAGLTSLMRNKVDSEENLPMKGARSLHQRLLGLQSSSESD